MLQQQDRNLFFRNWKHSVLDIRFNFKELPIYYFYSKGNKLFKNQSYR